MTEMTPLELETARPGYAMHVAGDWPYKVRAFLRGVEENSPEAEVERARWWSVHTDAQKRNATARAVLEWAQAMRKFIRRAKGPKLTRERSDMAAWDRHALAMCIVLWGLETRHFLAQTEFAKLTTRQREMLMEEICCPYLGVKLR